MKTGMLQCFQGKRLSSLGKTGDLEKTASRLGLHGRVTTSWRKKTPQGLFSPLPSLLGFQVALVVKNRPASAGNIRDMGLTPGLVRSPGGGHGNALQDSCLEKPMDRGAWQVIVRGVSKSLTQLSG